MKLEPGRQLGSYRVLESLGRGGMGEVWAVEHALLGTRHALKVLRRGQRSDLATEADLQQRVQSPFVLPITGTLPLDDATAVLMPWVRGGSLADLTDDGALDPGEALALWAGIVEGARALHAAGVAHRDLKPGNVLLRLESDRVAPMLADFGLARDLHTEATDTLGAVGSPRYAAPEQLQGQRSGAAADLWALGVLLCELLTGEHPFGDASGPALLVAMHEREPELERLPERARSWAGDLLRIDPGQRRLPAELPDPLVPRGGPTARWLASRVDARQRQIDLAAAPFAVPGEGSHFVGRTDTLDSLLDAAAPGRLVTLLGMGGMGKTRAAIRFAHAARDRFPGGTWFCDLTAAHDRSGLLGIVATQLGLQGSGDLSKPIDAFLRGHGRALLVLDNAEHLVEPLRGLCEGWLRGAELTVLATSRRAIGLDDEARIDLQPLDPVEGAQLFVERARALQPDFRIPPEQIPLLDDLVEQLDGIPLAIELAAARTRVLPLEKLLRRLVDRFRLLSTREQGRHARLQATLDASWELLSGDEQQSMTCLAVCAGGFDLELAGAVLDVPSDWAQPAVETLAEHSLVRPLSDLRFGMLPTIREYTQRVGEARGAREAARHHAHHMAGRIQHARDADEPGLGRVERHNLEAACRWATEAGELEVAAHCLRGARWLFKYVGQPHVAVELGELLLEAGASPTIQADVHYDIGVAELQRGRSDAATTHTERAVALCDELGLDSLAVGALTHLAFCRVWLKDGAGAIEAAERAVELAEPTGSPHAAKAMEQYASLLAGFRGQREAALAILERAQRSAFAEGQHGMTPRIQSMKASTLRLLGRASEAIEPMLAAVEAHRLEGNLPSLSSALTSLAIVYQDLHRLDDAEDALQEATALGRRVGRHHELVATLNLAKVRQCQGRLQEAEELTRQCLADLESTGHALMKGISKGILGDILVDAQRGDEGRRYIDEARQVALESGMVDYASAFACTLARLDLLQGAAETAWQRLEADCDPSVLEAAARPDHLTVRLASAVATDRWDDVRETLERARSLLPAVENPQKESELTAAIAKAENALATHT